VDEFKLVNSYESVRQTLLQEEYADRLKKPLGFWVLPNDRRLPMAFLGRTLGDLLSKPFDELTATPGIGQKKISSLLRLLQRATRDEPPGVPPDLNDIAGEACLAEKQSGQVPFSPLMVSEALWAEWREMVQRYNIGGEKIGRVAPSLRRLPTVIWHTPLNQYTGQSISQIRQLRTHGEKRVRCVFEVFYSVYERLSKLTPGEDVYRALTPPLIVSVQDWVGSQSGSDRLPSEEDVRKNFALPMLNQIKIDSGETVHQLAEQRLGIDVEPQSVREQSRKLGVTRARVYQLLDDCAKVMHVRWPDGKRCLDALTTQFAALGPDSDNLALFFAVRELCYPEKSKGIVHAAHDVAVTPTEQVPDTSMTG
jgi:hypothetical protein